MKGLSDLFKQAQQMQSQMQQMQQELATQEVTGEAGAGLVKVTMNGRHEATRVQLDPSLAQESLEILEDLVAAAINDAVRRLEAHQRERMAGLTQGLNLPPGFKMPF